MFINGDWSIGLLPAVTALLLTVTHATNVWYEKAPRLDDPCTLHVYGKQKYEMQNAFSDPSCHHGGLIWYKTLGRIHTHLFTSWDRSQEFKLCMTSGLFDYVYVWWDSHRDYWQPMGWQSHHAFIEMTEEYRCRPSSNGSIDIYFESPWAEVNYIAYVKWELTPVSDEENEAMWFEIESTRRGPKPAEDDDANKAMSEYFVFLLDILSRNLIFVLPTLVVVTPAFFYAKHKYMSKYKKQEISTENGTQEKKTNVKARTKSKK